MLAEWKICYEINSFLVCISVRLFVCIVRLFNQFLIIFTNLSFLLFQDVLDVLLAAQAKDPNITTEILLAQAIVLLTVVHASTSTTIAIATYYIAKHKDVQRKLQQEIDSVSIEEGFPSWEHLHKQLPYLGQVVNETLRLYPSGK